MRKTIAQTTMAALLVATTAACGGEAEREVERQARTGPMTVVPVRQSTGVLPPVPPQVVQQLRAEYPVLREERAPEPSPDASPETVPERLRNALPAGVLETVTGEATYYADRFEGRRTASGIPFRQNQMVAAHRAYPFGTLLRVTNLRNERSVNVRVVDRGPFGKHARPGGTILDLSRRAANELDYTRAGRTRVKVEVLEWGEGVPRAS